MAGPVLAEGSRRSDTGWKAVAAPLVSTCTATVDVPCPVVSTQPITAQGAPPLDVFQRAVSNAFVTPIAWFDHLFFRNREEIETNGSYLRIVVGPQWVKGEGIKIHRAIRVKAAVPHLQHRLNLIFSSDDENAVDTPVTDKAGLLNRGLPVAQAAPPDSVNRSRAGLGYQLLRFIDTDVNVETALRSHERGELSLRIRHKLPKWYETTTKFYLTGFWLQGTGFGSTAQLNNERALSDHTLLQFDNSATQLHAVNGVFEESRLSLETRISQKAGISPGVGLRSATSPNIRATAFYMSVVYRESFFRDWLFYEVEPGVNWNRDAFSAFPPQSFVALRFEAQFRKRD